MNIVDFCKHLLAKYGNPPVADPETIANEFAWFFSVPKFVTIDYLVSLAKFLNIDQIRSEKLPTNIRGFHYKSMRRCELYYSKDDWQGGREHSILHEFYELIEKHLDELCPDFKIRTDKMSRGSGRQICSNHFDAVHTVSF